MAALASLLRSRAYLPHPSGDVRWALGMRRMVHGSAACLTTPLRWTNPNPASPFAVTTARGFLPQQDPLATLPPKFDALNQLLEQMPVELPNGKPGLLAKGELGDAVMRELPLYDMDGVHDPELLMALFRDYTFLASAYLLEPCDILYRETGEYGLGRPVLPKHIAMPLEAVAARIGAKPFMEYAQSYALYNFRRLNPDLPHTVDNLKPIRLFAGSDSEAGFILVHIAMVAHSGRLVDNALRALQSVEKADQAQFQTAMRGYRDAMRDILDVMETMWQHSRTSEYLVFRTFIMGSKNQPMFPNGITFEGTPPESNPRFYRGESGANDSIVPTTDNLLQLTSRMPSNPLTQTLRDFRSYRPQNHRAFVSFVEQTAKQLNVRAFAFNDAESNALYLENLDLVRGFRHKHWLFTKEYIIKYSNHPVATGGSPIVTWLPNQLNAVLEAIDEAAGHLDLAKLPTERRAEIEGIIARAATQRRVLVREVEELKQKFPGQDHLASA
ncbi:hypothetical protein H4R35_000963 [Dimargaris xerosporica]|nr:hypothetical protein H4R35_000963 [Dimargaris xerosporica]